MADERETASVNGDLPTLMRMARKVYARTFAKTEDVDEAAELIAKDMAALGKDGRTVSERNAFSGRNLLVWLWSGRWASCAFPIVVVSDEAATRLLQRLPARAPRVMAMAPTLWPAFLIELPRGLLTMHNGERALSIDYVNVMFDRGARWLGTISRDTSLGWTSVCTDEGFSHELTNQAEEEARVLGWLWRCVLGSIEIMEDPQLYVAPRGAPDDDPSVTKAPRRYVLR